MRARVTVHTQADFEVWLKQAAQAAAGGGTGS
jgi:hypothetical protein